MEFLMHHIKYELGSWAYKSMQITCGQTKKMEEFLFQREEFFPFQRKKEKKNSGSFPSCFSIFLK